MDTLGDLIMKIGFSIVMVAAAIWIVSHVRRIWKNL